MSSSRGDEGSCPGIPPLQLSKREMWLAIVSDPICYKGDNSVMSCRFPMTFTEVTRVGAGLTVWQPDIDLEGSPDVISVHRAEFTSDRRVARSYLPILDRIASLVSTAPMLHIYGVHVNASLLKPLEWTLLAMPDTLAGKAEVFLRALAQCRFVDIPDTLFGVMTASDRSSFGLEELRLFLEECGDVNAEFDVEATPDKQVALAAQLIEKRKWRKPTFLRG